jgi:hypothetical protein
MLEVQARARTLVEGVSLRRVLPAPACRSVGPWVFLDHVGPVVRPPGEGLDVPPHPHIGLCTVTWLFEGALVHRDSLGSERTIRPGALVWMTAGKGVVHSERSPAEDRAAGARLHGLQLWLALPRGAEEVEPAFSHWPAEALPEVERGGVRVQVAIGTAFGATSPVEVFSPTILCEVGLAAGAGFDVPRSDGELAVYVAEGRVDVDRSVHGSGALLLLDAGAPATLAAVGPARVAVLGGAALDGPRHMWWNFVSSSSARIEQARARWRDGAFPPVPGDAAPGMPMPEAPWPLHGPGAPG